MELTLKINENISAKQAAKLTELGSMIEEGTLIEQDCQNAVRLYMIAAKAGDPEAFYHMGRVYRTCAGSCKGEALLQAGSKLRQYRFHCCDRTYIQG